MADAAIISWIAAPAVCFFLCFIWLRSVPLALLTALAPFVGALCASIWDASFTSAYGIGAAIAASLAAQLARENRGGDPVDPWVVLWPALAAILLCALENRRMGAGWCGAALGAGLVLPLGRLLPLDENWLARANRAAERRLESLEILALAATPRWGLALSGVALVLATLAGMRHGLHPAWITWTVLALVAAMVLAASRDPRAMIAAALGALFFLFFARGLPLFCFYVLMTAFCVRHLRPGQLARIKALEQADALVLAALAGLTGLSFAALAAPVTALLFVPAFAALLNLAAAPSRDLERLYRR